MIFPLQRYVDICLVTQPTNQPRLVLFEGKCFKFFYEFFYGGFEVGLNTVWITVGQGPTALEVGAGGGCLDIFILIYPFSPLSPSLWTTVGWLFWV